MGLFDNIKLPHTDPVSGEIVKVFQTKCGPRELRSMTPKELVDYNKGDADGINFYDYYYDYKDNGVFDSYYEEYCYNEKARMWRHTLTRKTVHPHSPEEGGPTISDEVTLTDENMPEVTFWSSKEEFMQAMSDLWDAKNPT